MSAEALGRHAGAAQAQTPHPVLALCPAVAAISTPYPPISWQRDGTCQLLLATLTLRTQFINGDRDWGIMLRIEKLDQISGINQLRPFLSGTD